MPKSTPGPWKFGVLSWGEFEEKPFDYRPNGFVGNPGIFSQDNKPVAACDEYYIFSNAADVALIAAAPDLLAALEQAVARLQIANEEGSPILSAWLPEARAAIARAKGE